MINIKRKTFFLAISFSITIICVFNAPKTTAQPPEPPPSFEDFLADHLFCKHFDVVPDSKRLFLLKEALFEGVPNDTIEELIINFENFLSLFEGVPNGTAEELIAAWSIYQGKTPSNKNLEILDVANKIASEAKAYQLTIAKKLINREKQWNREMKNILEKESTTFPCCLL